MLNNNIIKVCNNKSVEKAETRAYNLRKKPDNGGIPAKEKAPTTKPKPVKLLMLRIREKLVKFKFFVSSA